MMRSNAVSAFAHFRDDSEPLPVALDMEYVLDTLAGRQLQCRDTAAPRYIILIGPSP
ncbi:MAG: hypothetical protein ABI333_26895 [bacterium]